MRVVISLFCLSLVAACAVPQDPNQETASYDRNTTTGSNIPRKGSATTIDKSVVQDQQIRQGGSLQR